MHRFARPIERRALDLCLVACLLVAGCGSGPGDRTQQPATTSTTAAAGTALPATDQPAPTGGEGTEGHVVDVAIRDGSVEGGVEDVDVVLGREVVLRVSSDAAGEVHVHGYDLFVDAVAGEVAELRFVADLPGEWEVELEGTGLRLASLRVAE